MLPATSIHPGEILAKEFAEPYGLSYYKIAKATGIPASRLHEIVAGNRSVSPDTAMRLSHAFGTTPEFWLNLQAMFDLVQVRKVNAKVYRNIHSIAPLETQELAEC